MIFPYMTFISFSKFNFLFSTHNEFFFKVLFYNFFTIVDSFKRFNNKFVNFIFTSIFLFRFTKSIINTYNCIFRTTSKMILIFMIFLNSFQNSFKVSINYKVASSYLCKKIYFRKFTLRPFSGFSVACLPFISEHLSRWFNNSSLLLKYRKHFMQNCFISLWFFFLNINQLI